MQSNAEKLDIAVTSFITKTVARGGGHTAAIVTNVLAV